MMGKIGLMSDGQYMGLTHVRHAPSRAASMHWQVPSGQLGGERRYVQQDPMYDTECLDPKVGMFLPGDTELDTHGKY